MAVSHKQGNEVHMSVSITEDFLRQVERLKEAGLRQGVAGKIDFLQLNNILFKPLFNS